MTAALISIDNPSNRSRIRGHAPDPPSRNRTASATADAKA